MSAFDLHTWYILSNAAQSGNRTLTAANNTQAAFDPDSPSALFYSSIPWVDALSNAQTVSNSQLWQIYPIITTTSSAYVFRNRAVGPNAYLTTAWTTRKCGGGSCATVPVLSPDLNQESLWNFGSWGYSDAIGGAFIYSVGNGSNWRLDGGLDNGTQPEMLDYIDTGRRSSHWFPTSYASFATNDVAGFTQIPSAATTLLAQVTGTTTGGSVSLYVPVATGTGSASRSSTNAGTTSTSGANNNNTSSGLSTGAAVGLGVGLGIAGVLVIIGVAFLILSRRRKRRKAMLATKSADTQLEKPNDARPSVTEFPTKDAAYQYSELSSPTQHNSKAFQSEMMHPSEPLRPEMESSTKRYELSGN